METIRHNWNLLPKEAVALQKQLREKVILQPLDKEIHLIGGTDISFDLHSNEVYAGIVVLDYKTLQMLHYSVVKEKATFPYIPGLLSFREIPSLAKAWEKLDKKPDVVMVDGHGIAHPRRMGIATHFGLITGVPTLGCAKKILTGTFKEPDPEKGSYSPIYAGKEILGCAVRTKDKVKPVFISPGHLIGFKDALRIALKCAVKYKLPEPTRLTHNLVNAFRRGEISEN